MEALIFVNNRSDDNHAELYTAEIYRKTWEKFVAQVDDGNDMGMMSKISIVEKFGSNLPEYVEILQEQSQYGMEDPQVEIVFSTVHKFNYWPGIDWGFITLVYYYRVDTSALKFSSCIKVSYFIAVVLRCLKSCVS